MSFDHLFDAVHMEPEDDADDFVLQAATQVFGLRKTALYSARNDRAEGESVADILARAKAYYEFLLMPNAEKPRRADAHPPSPDEVEREIKATLRAAGFNVL